ncbi:MAG: hypothetical protein U0X20_00555 [Caldilineaceae bacterium]
MRCARGCSRFLPGGLFLLVVALFSGCVWQSAAAHDGVLVRVLPGLHDPGGGYRPAASNSVTLTVWASEVVTTQAGIGFRGDALRFDREGRPALVYTVQLSETTTATVYFARREGTVWQIEEAGSGAESLPTLTFDAQDGPHIIYQQSGVIYHAQRNGNVWSRDVVDTGKGAVGAATIAASDAGTVGLAFSAPTEDPPALYYARLSGSDWIVETVMTGTQEGYWHTNWFLGELDFDYDSQGRPHIGFVKTASGLPRDIGSLIHVANIAGIWRNAYVATNMYITGHAMSMADGLGGKVAYSSFGPPCVIPCTRTNTMGVVAIDADGSPGFPWYERSGSDLAALAVQGDIPELLYRHYSSAGRELWHDRIGTDTIESTLLAIDDFGSAALALNSQGEPLVMYYVPSSHHLVTVRPIQVTFPYGLHLPFIGSAQAGSEAR